MPNIKPISDLRNYTSVINEVSYGQRVYLTRNGHGEYAIIDMKELDELDKKKALYELMSRLEEAEESICTEGTVPAEEVEKELGVGWLKKVEYSQIAIRKLKELKARLLDEYGTEISTKTIKQITTAIRNLAIFERRGISISTMYELKSNYFYLYVRHYYIFYRIEQDKIYIIDIFHEKEDFMYKLFGMRTVSDNIVYYKNY